MIFNAIDSFIFLLMSWALDLIIVCSESKTFRIACIILLLFFVDGLITQ